MRSMIIVAQYYYVFLSSQYCMRKWTSVLTFVAAADDAADGVLADDVDLLMEAATIALSAPLTLRVCGQVERPRRTRSLRATRLATSNTCIIHGAFNSNTTLDQLRFSFPFLFHSGFSII